MSGKGKHGVVQGLRRFFWMPRGTPRGPAAAVPLLRAWLFCLVGLDEFSSGVGGGAVEPGQAEGRR